MTTEDLHATDSKEPNSDVESENSDDLEMPVLKAEIPWPPSLAAKSAAKADNVAAKSAAKAGNVAAKSSAKNDATKSGGSCGGSCGATPEVANKVKSCDHVASLIRPLDDRDQQQTENSLLSGGTVSALCDKNYESNEKPKTSEKCYYNTSSTPLPSAVSDTSDSEAVSSSRSFGNGKTTEPPSRQKPPPAGLSDSDSDSDLELLCLRRKKVPTSQQIAEGSSEFKLEEENTEQVFDRLVHSSSKGKTAAATKTTATKTTTADKNATALTSSAVRHGEKGDKMVTSFGDESDQQQALRQRREKIQQQQQSPIKNEVGGGGSTSSIWGKQIASFDLSDDYVNDYLREQQAKKIENIPDDPTSSQVADLLGGVNATSPHRLLSSPPPSSSSHQRQARKVASRAASFDIIPACVPDSIGTEIDDILHSGFITMGGGKYGNIHDSEASQDAVSLSSMTSSMSGSGPVLGGGGGGRSGRRASKRRSGGKGASGPECSPAAAGRRSGGKKARQKSTDNLHPNLLPGSSSLFIFIREIQHWL